MEHRFWHPRWRVGPTSCWRSARPAMLETSMNLVDFTMRRLMHQMPFVCERQRLARCQFVLAQAQGSPRPRIAPLHALNPPVFKLFALQERSCPLF